MSSDEASREDSVASGAVRSLLVSNAPSLLKSTIVRAYDREEAFIEDELDDDYAHSPVARAHWRRELLTGKKAHMAAQNKLHARDNANKRKNIIMEIINSGGGKEEWGMQSSSSSGEEDEGGGAEKREKKGLDEKDGEGGKGLEEGDRAAILAEIEREAQERMASAAESETVVLSKDGSESGQASLWLPHTKRSRIITSSMGPAEKRRVLKAALYDDLDELFEAIREENISLIEQILSHEEVGVNAFNRNGLSAMHCAAGFGSIKCMEVLLKLEGNINVSKNNHTPYAHALNSVSRGFGATFQTLDWMVNKGAELPRRSRVQKEAKATLKEYNRREKKKSEKKNAKDMRRRFGRSPSPSRSRSKERKKDDGQKKSKSKSQSKKKKMDKSPKSKNNEKK